VRLRIIIATDPAPAKSALRATAIWPPRPTTRSGVCP